MMSDKILCFSKLNVALKEMMVVGMLENLFEIYTVFIKIGGSQFFYFEIENGLLFIDRRGI